MTSLDGGAPSLEVAVVDDHPMWRETMVQVVERFGIGRVVAQAGNGAEALDILGEVQPDVIVMDVDMPDLDGVEVTQLLRANGVHAHVLFLSSFDDRDKVVGAVRAGASGYLLKTSGASQVAKAIRRIAEGELVFPPDLTAVLLQELRQGPTGAVATQGAARAAVPPPPAQVPDVPPPAPRPTGPTEVTASIELSGKVWTLAFDGVAAHLPNVKGIGYIDQLIQARGREVMALDLMVRPDGGVRSRVAHDDGLTVGEAGLGPILDDAAKRAYRTRIHDLQQELEEATSFNDPERAARAREELDQLTAQLTAAVGIGGRDRTTSSDAERARVAVTRSIRRAIAKIAEVHPPLGEHLEQSVSTGTFCHYRDPTNGVRWDR